MPARKPLAMIRVVAIQEGREVYLNLFVDEFVVALAGSLTSVSPDEVSDLASSSEIPKHRLSQRPWVLFASGH
jgi:hypothetical protein